MVLDEAYREYVDAPGYPDALALQRRYPNLIVTRTFSKIHGLAALRLGWVYCPPAVADVLNRMRGPFNVSAAGAPPFCNAQRAQATTGGSK